MPWFVTLSILLLLAALTGLFVVFARLIRRDLDERFNRIQGRLEEEANEVVDDLLKEDRSRSARRE